MRNLGEKEKYKGIATSHGFRATFRTICSQNKAELLNLGISEEAIESALAHKEQICLRARKSHHRTKSKAYAMVWRLFKLHRTVRNLVFSFYQWGFTPNPTDKKKS